MTNTTTLDGKVALVTGGGSGIGRGFALEMHREGAAVTVIDMDENAARRVAAEIQADGGRAWAYPADVTDASEMQQAVEQTIQRLGGLHIVFANAGVLGPAAFTDITPEDWERVLAVNVRGVAHTCEAAVPHLKAQKWGRILITGSYNGVRAGAHVIPYRVSKAAVLMYTRCLALELAPYNVTTNAICPGVTLTPMQLAYAEEAAARQGVTREEYLAERVERIPMGQFTTVEDLSALAAFLVGEGGRLITGQTIAVDGGVMASS